MKRLFADESGFTLFELMVTIGMMLIIMGLTAYAIVSYSRAQQLTGTTNEVLTDFRDAQIRSQGEVRPYRIIFDTSADKYTVQRQDSTVPSASCSSTDGGVCWNNVESKTLSSEVDLQTADFGPDASIAYFYPRGTSSTGSIVLRSKKLAQDRQISLEGLTAKAKVS